MSGNWVLGFGSVKAMAIASRLISLNLGSQTMGLAEFRVQAHGGLVLLDYRLREMSSDPTSDEMRRAQIAVVVDHTTTA